MRAPAAALLCRKLSRLPDLPAAQAPSPMEQLTGDDRNMVGLGWHFVATTGRSMPVTTHTDALGLNSFENRGSSLSLSNTNTLAFTFTHFFSESWATELGGVTSRADMWLSSFWRERLR